MRSASDDKIFEYATRENLILVTRDLGFGIMFIKNKGFGLLLSRLPYYFTAEEMKNSFDKFLEAVDENIFPGSITVLEVGRYRIKRL